uniref:alpha/beta hydrolase domain-containing protein 17B n=1 Tax=Erigeron canadensis TaxID=72917 RepID=UPI001CB930F5|nr:alpha/beta hydrolase domain-containing protein 17B [Erigeron canadensis]
MGCFISSLVAKFAFFPPSPPTYEIKKLDDGKAFAVYSPSNIPLTGEDSGTGGGGGCLVDVLSLKTKRGNKIVAFYLKNPYARLTLLYSHGNAADLGQLFDLFVQLKANLRVNIMGYDYSGYGASTGKPSELNTYADIEAVYECLETEYGVSQEDLILYGQSVGSGPTLHLAAKLPRLRGVVLHSGILSGLRVVCHMKCTLCFDIYKNVNKIRKVKCPTLVIHGTEDDVVNWLHGNGLWKMAKDPYEPLWIKGGGHCNLELYPEYIRHLSRFIHEMETMTTKTRLSKIKPTLRLPNKSKSKSNPDNSSTSTKTCTCCCIKLMVTKCFKCPRPHCPKCINCFKQSCCLLNWNCGCCWWRKPKCPNVKLPKCPSCLRCRCFTCSCNCVSCSCW